MTKRDVPDFYQDIAADDRRVAMLDLPVEGYVAAKFYMLYQMEHGHAIVGGWRDRRPPEVGIGYIVLHKKFLEPERLDELTTHLNEQAGPAIYDDEDITAYKLPDVAEIAPLPVPAD